MTTQPVEFIYGINPAFEVIRAGRRTIKKAFLSKSSEKNPRIKKLVEVLKKNKIQLQWMEKGRLIDMTKSHDHQGIVLECTAFEYSDYRDILEQNDKVLLLNNIEDPHNAGAILRSAEVFGFKAVFMPNRGTPEIYASVVKVSAGATEFMDICRNRSANQYVKAAKDEAFKVISLDGKGDTPIKEISRNEGDKILLVIGGEDKGVGQFIINESENVIKIEQHGKINSLNASVAAGIAMHQLA